MLRHSRFLVGCAGAAFAVTSFFVGLEVSATTAAPAFDRSAPMVNRTLKGDRQQFLPAKSRNAVNGPLEMKAPPAPKLLDGCEPVVSAIGQSPLAQIPGRCVSQAPPFYPFRDIKTHRPVADGAIVVLGRFEHIRLWNL